MWSIRKLTKLQWSLDFVNAVRELGVLGEGAEVCSKWLSALPHTPLEPLGRGMTAKDATDTTVRGA